MNAIMSALSASQKDFFGREGYLVVEDVLDPARDLKLLMEEHGRILDRLARRLLDAGDIENYDLGATFGQRVLQVMRASAPFSIQAFDFSLPQKDIQADTPIYLGNGAFSVLTHPLLLDLVESIIGPEITVSPVQHFRIKTPLSLGGADVESNGTPSPPIPPPPTRTSACKPPTPTRARS